MHPQLQAPLSSRRLFAGFASVPESIWSLKASVQTDLSSAKYWNSGRMLPLLYILWSHQQNSKLSTLNLWKLFGFYTHQELKVILDTKENLLSNTHSPAVGWRRLWEVCGAHMQRTSAVFCSGPQHFQFQCWPGFIVKKISTHSCSNIYFHCASVCSLCSVTWSALSLVIVNQGTASKGVRVRQT